jgi:RNA-directed DNA polymerase
LNREKTRMVTLTDRKAVFAFLGFEFRWARGKRSGRWYPAMTPRPKAVVQVLRNIRDVLRSERSSPVKAAVARVNEVVRGWVNYFRVGNSSQAFAKVRLNVELRVRRFMSKKQKRTGFGWKRWSQNVVYETWGLYSDYRLVYGGAARANPNGSINPLR